MEVYIFVGIKLCGGCKEFEVFFVDLISKGYECFDLLDNELVKLYVCYMVGGCLFMILNEVVFSFEFLEYFGVLFNFLNMLGECWNIILFYYCNYGVVEGLVLVGFDILLESCEVFDEYVVVFNYEYQDVIVNFVYWFFLFEFEKV